MNSFKTVDAVDATTVANLMTRWDLSLYEAQRVVAQARSWDVADVDTMAAATPTTVWSGVPSGETAYGLIAATAVLILVVAFMASFGSMVGVTP